MGGVKTSIKASSLIEVIVASAVFMVVFLISLQTIGKITTKNDISIELIDAQNKIYAAFRAAQNEPTPAIFQYDWGNITIVKQKYKNFNDLTLLKIEVVLDRNNKKIVRYFIIRNELH